MPLRQFKLLGWKRTEGKPGFQDLAFECDAVIQIHELPDDVAEAIKEQGWADFTKVETEEIQ